MPINIDFIVTFSQEQWTEIQHKKTVCYPITKKLQTSNIITHCVFTHVLCKCGLHTDLLNVLSSLCNLGLLEVLDGVREARRLPRDSCFDSDGKIMQ